MKLAGVEVITEEKIEEEDEENKRVINKWIIKVAEQIIQKHAEKPTLEELIFGPGNTAEIVDSNPIGLK